VFFSASGCVEVPNVQCVVVGEMLGEMAKFPVWCVDSRGPVAGGWRGFHCGSGVLESCKWLGDRGLGELGGKVEFVKKCGRGLSAN
jgi:hypothetical protein